VTISLRPTVFIHILLTWVMAWWCFILGLPGDTFATLAVYRGFSALMSEEAWSAATGIVFLIGAAGLYWPRVREASQYILSFAHGVIGMTIITTAPLNTGSGVYGGLMVAGWYLIAFNRYHD